MANDSLFVQVEGEASDEELLQEDDLLEIMDMPDAPDSEDSALKLAQYELEGLQIDAPAYDCSFRQVMFDLKDMCEQLCDSVPEKHRGHALFAHLVSELKGAAVFPSPPKRRINIIGRSGAGKSSVLNSLMCRSGLAKANALGEGCTHVPTAYEGPFLGQTSTFALRIQCFSINQIRKKLECMWHDYYLEHFEEEDKGDWPEDDKERVRQAAETALDALRTLFMERSEFANENKAKAFLKRCSRKSTEKVIDELTDWCKDLLPVTTEPSKDSALAGADDRLPVFSMEVSTEAELSAQLEKYAFSDSSFEEKSLWPLVDVVRLGLDNIPILQHVTLVDWPGVGDTNELRAKASTERVTDCDEVWIVATPDRILTDPTVWSCVHRYADSYPCTIICTQTDLKCEEPTEIPRSQSDNIKIQKLRELKKEDNSLALRITKSQYECERRDEMDTTGYKTEPGGKRRKLGKAALEQNRNFRKARSLELQNMRARHPEVQQERRQLIVDMNTANLRQKLEEKVDKVSPSAIATNIFFVSNEHYMAHKRVKDVGGALLTLEGTGIPLLRAHILRQASPSVVASMNHYVGGDIERILTGVALTTMPEELEECQGLLQRIVKKHDSGDQIGKTYLATVEKASTDSITAPVTKSIDQLVANALLEVQKHRSWHPMVLKAFVRKDGAWGTKTQKAEKWNEGFAGILSAVFVEHWDPYTDMEDRAFDLLKSLLVAEIKSVFDIAKERSNGERLSGGRFEELIDSQIKHLENECTKAKAAYAEKMKAIKVDATKVGCNYSTSNFDQAMRKTYEQGRAIRGHGYKKRVNDWFAASLKLKGAQSPYISAALRTQNDVKRAATKQARAIVDDYSARIADIGDWLNSALGQQADLTTLLDIRRALTLKHQWACLKFAECKTRLASVEAKYAEIEREQDEEMIRAAQLQKKGKAKGKGKA